MRISKRRTKQVGIVTLLGSLAVVVGIFLYVFLVPQGTQIKNVTEDALPLAKLPPELKLEPTTLEHTFISPELEADFEFNAIAPMWEAHGANQQLELRTADSKGSWTSWMAIEAAPAMRDDKASTTRYFPETPIFVEGKRFQYRITLKRASVESPSPTVSNLRINYLDSRPSLQQKIKGAITGFFGNKRAVAKASPYVISRAEWGSPDPHNQIFKGTDKYWAHSYVQTKQIFLHHTVSPSVHSDPKSIIRGIWEYHANTLGWGDIGYNYLVDFKGNIYEGRHGGDNVVAGHTLDYNRGSMGVAVLGCFEPNSTCNQLNWEGTKAPTPATIEGLTNLLSWKTSNFRINPDFTHTFCKADGSGCISIPTIAAHRQAFPTECNGEYFYQLMNQVRQKVAGRNRLNLWGVEDVNFLQKTANSTTQQLFHGTDFHLFVSLWGPSYPNITKLKLMTAPLGERFVDSYTLDEPDGSQTVFAATQSSIYSISFHNGIVGPAQKLVTRASDDIKKVFADIREESATTHRLYVLANDGPHEYWWRDGPVSGGGLLWNINNGIDFVKTRDPADKDEMYVATKSEVYRMKWPINSDIERLKMTSISGTTALAKQNLTGGTELLYTGTKDGVYETWWKPNTGFSQPGKIIQSSRAVLAIKKTITGNYQQLYVAQPGSVHEFWWGPGSNGIRGSRLIHISQDTIVAIDKATLGSYQNLYTASQTFIYETWWGNGRIGTGVIVDTRR